MGSELLIDSFLTLPPDLPVKIPEEIETLQDALRLSPLNKPEIKKFLQNEAAKLQISSDDNTRVFDPDSLESFRQRVLKLLKVLKKDTASDDKDTFLFMYPFFENFEELKALLLSCFAGRIEQKDYLFRALYKKIENTEKTLKWILNPSTKRDPIRSVIERWIVDFQKKKLNGHIFHPDGISPFKLIEHFFTYDQQRVKEETDIYLKNYYTNEIRKKKYQLHQAGVNSAKIDQTISKFKLALTQNKKEHYFTYGEIKKLDIIKSNLAIELNNLIEYQSRSFILALPNEIFNLQDKENLERSTHDGEFKEIGQENNLKRHQRLIKEYQALSNENLIKRLLLYKENKNALHNSHDTERVIKQLAQLSNIEISDRNIHQDSKKILNTLLLRLATSSLRRRTYRYQLKKFMEQYGDKPLFPQGKAFDYGGITYGLAGLLQDLIFNPYREIYHMVQRISVTDWCVYQLGDLDREKGESLYSSLKADIYENHGLAIYDKKDERREDFFYESLRDNDRCHTTGVRNLELNSLEKLPPLKFFSIFVDLHEQIKTLPEPQNTIPGMVQCYGIQEEMLEIVRSLELLSRERQHSEFWDLHPQQQSFPNIADSLANMIDVQDQQRKHERTQRTTLEAQLAKLQRPIVTEYSEIIEEIEEYKLESPDGKFHTLTPELPSFRNTPAGKENLRAAPLVFYHEELEQRHFLLNNINYYPHFVEVAKSILEYYQEDIIRCSAIYTHDERFAGKVDFQEQVVYLLVDDNHIIALGKTYLYIDPTLQQHDFTYYVRFFVRNKVYSKVPREKGVASFKNMIALPTHHSLQIFEEVVLGQFKSTTKNHFKNIFKASLLSIVKSLSEEHYRLPIIQTFLEFLTPNMKISPPIGPKLRQRLKEFGLEDRLMIKPAHELVRGRVAPSVQEVYQILKKANTPIFRARKKKLEMERVPLTQQKVILKKIEYDDKIRLYTMASVLEIYITLKKNVPDFDENGLYAIAGHFYGFKPGQLPEGIRSFLSAHLKFFQ